MLNKVCQCCGHDKPLNMFALDRRGQPRKTCRPCYAGAHRNVDLRADNRAFNRLVAWRPSC